MLLFFSAAQPEELQRAQKEFADLQTRFNSLNDEKMSMEERLREQDADLKKANDQLRHAERTRVELKSKLVELSVLKAQLQQQEIVQREKDVLSNKVSIN
jgi:septal ring factor EnvC (AmiA/AmiB activator)